MVNRVEVSRFALPFSFVGCLLLSGVAMSVYNEETTKGAAYSYVQPDNATFGVWGLIYALLMVLCIAQCCAVDVKGLKEARAWLAVNFITNGAWLIVNGAANTAGGFSYWFAVVVLFLNLYALVKCYEVLDIDYTRKDASFLTKVCFFLPVSCNLSWVLLASVLNLSNTVFDANDTSKLAIGGADFAIAVCSVACILACYLVVTRLDFGYALISIVYFAGIHRNQVAGGDSPLPASQNLDSMAIGCGIVIVLASLFGVALYVCGASSYEEDSIAEEKRQGSAASRPLVSSYHAM